MLYDNYRQNVVYNSQAKINFPRSGNGKPGEGIALFLMTPNRNRAIEVIQDPIMNLNQNLIKRFVTDAIYREKIGSSRIISMERSQTDRYYLNIKDFPLMYINAASKNNVLQKKKNVVNDLSRWMDIIFSRMDNLSSKKKCSEFIRILKDRINDPLFRGYKKIMVVDINSWVASIKSCVIMNRKLLNNPISILLFAANYYPELLANFPNTTLMITNRASGQLFITDTNYLNKRNYMKIKAKLSLFKSMVFSVEDTYDPTDDQIEEEIKAQFVNELKENLRNQLRYNLLGNGSTSDDPFNDIDITSNTTDPMDEDLIELTKEMDEVSSAENSTEEVISDENKEDEDSFSINEEISKAVEDAVDDIDDLTNIEEVDVTEIANDIADQIRDRKYRAAFIPEKTKEEKERIARLTQIQDQTIPSKEDVERKTIKSSITGGYINTTNPNIISSKFKNFDKDYVEKCMEKDIDDAVKILSSAETKIFITNKKVTDSSTPQDLKMTYTYSLEDEKGNKWKISFDIPRIIDNNYVYLNGTKKTIRHQFILKPIVKTSPDVVQLVTFYNKVFIYRRGIVNQNVNRIVSYLQKNEEVFKVQEGNTSRKNDNYDIPLDLAMFSRYFSNFTINDYTFYTSIDSLLAAYKKMKREELVFDKSIELPIAINQKKKEVLMFNLASDSYTDIVYNAFDDLNKNAIKKIKRKPKLVTASAKILKRELPLVLFMMFCEGFASVMKKANIQYEFISKDSKKSYDAMTWDSIELSDGYIIWKKTPFRNELIMNGLKAEDLTEYSYEDLESKDTFISLILPKYPGNGKIHVALDNYKDFLLDMKTKEILQDLGYPTDLVSLLIVAAGMLTDTHYLIENNLNNMRIRSNEVVSQLVYMAITKAYTEYRSTNYKKKPTKVTIRKNEIIDALLSGDTNIIEEYSSLNPVLEIEKTRSVTFKGIRGIQLARAMTLPRRAYDKSMMGTISPSTSPDALVGVVRSLSLEPKITSTYGYIDANNDPDDLNSANLFSAVELLTPFGVKHNDPDRTAMSFKQTKYMIPVKDADPVLIGNKVESIVPYITSDEFVVYAEKSGVVVDKTKDYLIIQYDDGTYKAIDISNRVRKNSSNGTWMNNSLYTKLEVGDKFKEGEVIAYNDKHFTKNKEDIGASMNLGVLCKVAISSQWDVFEDSAPISRRLSEKLTSEMVDEKHITFSPHTYIEKIVKIGDKIKAGEPLVVFSDAMTDELQKLFDTMREENKEAVVESAKTSIYSKYTGEVIDIKIFTTSELEELHPSMRKIIEDYWKRINKKNALLDKYKNPGDQEYYKASQIINEVTEVIHPGKNGKINGYYVDDGDVLFLFYIKYPVAASKGDKVVCSVCKGIVSHVFKEGMEPYSEYRPDEVIDTIVAPLAVAARKVPEIFLTIFGNKLLIELKRQVKEMYLDDK